MVNNAEWAIEVQWTKDGPWERMAARYGTREIAGRWLTAVRRESGRPCRIVRVVVPASEA